MKNSEEFNAFKEAMNKKTAMLTDEDLVQVNGGGNQTKYSWQCLHCRKGGISSTKHKKCPECGWSSPYYEIKEMIIPPSIEPPRR